MWTNESTIKIIRWITLSILRSAHTSAHHSHPFHSNLFVILLWITFIWLMSCGRLFCCCSSLLLCLQNYCENGFEFRKHAPQSTNLTKSSECMSVLNKLNGFFFFVSFVVHKCYCILKSYTPYGWMNSYRFIYIHICIIGFIFYSVCPYIYEFCVFSLFLHNAYLYFSQSVFCFLLPFP